MENISKKLQSEIPAFDSDKLYQFKLLSAKYDNKLKRLIVPTNRNVVAEDVIFDYHSNKSVDIQCIDRKVAKGQGIHGSDIILKKINFNRKENGKKILDGKMKGSMNLFEYMYLSNFNRANRGKPWHIPPRGGYIYEFMLPEKTAEEKLQSKKESLKAQQLVMDLSNEEISIVSEALQKSTSVTGFNYSPKTEVNQLREKLVEFAAKNPSRMLNFDKDFNIEARKLIQTAVDAGLIIFDDNRKQVSWGDTGNKICLIESGRDSKATLVGYFTTKEGKQVVKTIIANLEEVKA